MLAQSSLPNLLWLIAAVPALAVALQWQRRRGLLARLDRMLERTAGAPQTSGVAPMLAWLGTRLPGMADRTFKAAALQAGCFHPAALPILAALRAVLVLAGIALPLVMSENIGAKDILGAAFGGFFASRFFLAGLKAMADARLSQIRREMPPVVDMLLMVLGSGVSIDQALRHVTSMLEQPAPRTAAVFRSYVADIDHGMPYETAFERMGQRLGIDEGYDLAAMIKNALLKGGEIVAALQQFGAEVAEKRVALAREQVGRRAILLTIVMLVFFMPVLMVVLGGPAVSTITQTLETVKHQLHDKESKP